MELGAQYKINPDPNENLFTGYVKLFRSIKNKSWYRKDSEFVHLWLHLLLEAAHSKYETWFEGKTIALSPGQLVTGRKKLSRETGIQELKVLRILNKLESEQQIKQQKTPRGSLISIVNWNKYQFSEQLIKQHVNNNCTTSEQQLNTIQEGKELNNVKNFKKNGEKNFLKNKLNGITGIIPDKPEEYYR